MAFVTLSLSELLRAYTARSERYPLLSLGIFTNRYMNLAILVSAVLVLAVVYIPFFQTPFNTTPLGWSQWELILPLFLIPSLAAEFSKYVMKWMRKSI
jgi:Ca2+-transporting ATPase